MAAPDAPSRLAADAADAAAATDRLPCPWLRLGPSGHIEACNAALAQVLGVDRHHLEGSAFDTWLSRPSLLIHQSVVQPLLRLHGHVSELALTLQAADGSTFDVLLYAARELDAPDAAASVQLVPIRQRRRIESELLRIKRAADQAPGMVFQLERDADGGWHFPYVSEAVRALYGCTADALARSAAGVLERIVPADRDALVAELMRCVDGGGSFRVLLRVGPPGQVSEPDREALRWHEYQGTARERGDGLLQWHGYASDVTERLAMQEAVTQARAQERTAKLRSEFMSRVSHELRTPLNGILGFAELMSSDPDTPPTEQQKQWLEIISSSGYHLLGIVDQLLDVAKLQSGKLEAHLEHVNLAQALQEATAAVAGMAQERGVMLVPMAGGEAPSALADPQHLRQVLINLLSNAIKYNRRGGRVTVHVERVGEQVRIDVQDTGIGMTAEQQAALFQPFQRLGAERLGIAGTGLGLVVCRHLLESMNGRLEVRSDTATGSVFSVWLPAAGSHQEPGTVSSSG